MQRHLVIFAKNPRIGQVKTRLARDIGAVPAWCFYRRLLFSLPRKLAQSPHWTTWLAISPDQTSSKILPLKKLGWLTQGKGDLGQRMLRPATILPVGSFIVVGTDIPQIRPRHIRKAFDLLGRNDAVFGPTTDGGFWLVGLKRHSRLVNPYRKPVRWSHPETLNDCLSNLVGRKIAMVDCLQDIDNGADLFKLPLAKGGLSHQILYGR